MRVVCGNCGARHWVIDGQLGGAPGCVTCQTCSTEIPVDQGAVDPQSLEPVWYVVLNNEQLGPISQQDVELYFSNQQLAMESYVWRDGYADWVQLGSLPEFDYLAYPVELHTDDATRVVGSGDPGFADFSEGGEATAAIDISGFSEEDYANLGASSAYGMGSASASPASSSAAQPNYGGAVEEPDDAGNELVGARSENSVLFSLSNLQAVSASVAKGNNAAAVPMTEGSGLIDVKALASNSPSQPRRRSFDQSSFDSPSPAMSMGVMLPLGNKKSNTPLFIGIGIAFVALVALVVILLVVLKKDEQAPAAPSADMLATAQGGQGDLLGMNNNMIPAGQGLAPAAVAPAAPTEQAAPAAAPAPTPEPAAAENAEEDKKEEANKADSDKKSSAKKDSAANTKKEAAAEKKEVKEDAPAPSKPAAKPAPSKPAPAPAPKPAAAASGLSKEEVQGVIRKNFGQVRTCSRTSQTKGSMKVSFVIKGDGRVANAKVVSPEFNGTPVASCVLKVVNSMKFRAAGGADVPITYPFSIQ